MNDIKVGLVVMSTYNYGNQMVNAALFRLINSLGYSTTCIFPPRDVSEDVRRETIYFEFSPYCKEDMVVPSSYADLIDIGKAFDIYVVGGDQLFRYDFMSRMHDYAYLDWVSDDKTKICIGTSFGLDYYENTYPYVLGKGRYWLERFQGCAVREASGKGILRDKFNISENVIDILDPVLFETDSSLRRLEHTIGEKNKQAVLGAYILDPCEEKKEIIDKISAHYELDAELIVDLGLEESKLGYDTTVRGKKTVEAWIAMIDQCDFFVTDSFHGICMALLLHKEFCVVFEKDSPRGYERINSILNMFGLDQRLVSNYEEFENRDIFHTTIDIEKIDRILLYKRKEGIEWIKNSLRSVPKRLVTSTDIFRQSHWKFKRFLPGVQYIAWGAGQFFIEYEDRLRRYGVQYVCDKRAELSGQEIIPGIICINEDELLSKRNVVIIVTIDSWDATMEIMREVYNHKKIVGVMHVLETYE